MNALVNPKNAGKGAYGQLVRGIAETGKCPFCAGEFTKYNPEPLLRYEGWFAAQSIRPYKNTSHHFLIISEEHKETLAELTDKDQAAILYLRKWLAEKYELQGLAYFMRIGEYRRTNASVKHLHEHVVSCSTEEPRSITARVLYKLFPKRAAVWVQIGNPFS